MNPLCNTIERSVLSNGLQVITCPMPYRTSVSLGVWIGVGGRDESAEDAGISHFIEHMLFKGTKTRSVSAIAREIEGRGGYYNAFTQEENTCYYGRTPSAHWVSLLDVLLDMVRHPRMDAGELEREREVILEEILMVQDQPSQWVQDLLHEGLWSGHPLGRPLTGSVEVLRRLRRSDLLRYKRQWYHPANMVVSFAGDLSHASAVKEVRKRMGLLKAGASIPRKLVTGRTARLPHMEAVKANEQVQMAFGYRIPGRHDSRRYALKLTSVILGENMSSRLFQRIREKHALAYAVSSQVEFFQDTGAFSIYSATEPERENRVRRLVDQEMDRLVEKTVSRAELSRAKDYAIGQFRMGQETANSMMMWCGESLMSYGDIPDAQEIENKLLAVNPEEIRTVAQEFLIPELRTFARVGPESGS